MTDRDHTPDLSAMLRERPLLERSAEGLLSLLAAAGEGVLAELKARLDHDGVEWDGLIDWLRDWPDPPADVASMHAWLRGTEDLCRAHEGLSRLGDVGHSDRVRRALSSSLERARAAVDARADHAFYAGEAEKHPIPPWTWIRRGDLERLLEDEQTAHDILRVATQAGLSAEDEALFARAVATRQPVLHAYRSLVRSLSEAVYVTTWTPTWSLDVARDASELDEAAELLRVHLPHAGGTLSVRQHVNGTWWRYANGAEALVPHDAGVHPWHDALLGAFETRIDVHAPTPAEDAWHGVANLLDVTCGQGKTRSCEIVQALATALTEGAMSDAIAAAHDAFEQGEDLDPESERLVSHAFVARLTMSDAAAQLDAQGIDLAPLMTALARADERHRAHRSAIFLVPDDVHDELVAALPVDPAEWWGHRAAVEAAVRPGMVESALVHIAGARREGVVHYLDLGPRDVQPPRETDQDSPPAYDVGRVIPYAVDVRRVQTVDPVAGYGRLSNVIAFRGPRAMAAGEVTRLAAASAPTLRPDLPREPCPWLHRSGEAPTPGCVPLILYDEEHNRGVLAELRVFVSDLPRESLTWAGAPMLERIARDTIRDAYRAAASCTANRIAPHPFAAHRLELVVDPSVARGARLSVDGSSVGLSAALAFASAWLDRPIARALVPLGTVARWGRVGGVGAARQKAGAVPANAKVTFIASKANADELGGVSVKPIEQLTEGLKAASLELSALSIAPSSEKARLKELGDLIDVVEDGDLGRIGEQARWTDVGDGIRDLVETFGTGGPHEPELSHARVMAALAYSHAGMTNDVQEMLRSVDRATCNSLEERTLYDIVELGRLIDNQKLEGSEARDTIERIETDMRELEQGGHRRMLGRAMGTLGRARMHSGDLDEALPLLAAAVDAHAAHEPYELARSRQYHAMALRMSGDPEAALAELVQAQRDLETLTRAYSPEYEASCRVFLEYELARTLVALERYEDAFAPASSALADCVWQPWPQLGLLRTRAWAHRMLGQDNLAAGDVERMRVIGPWLGPDNAALVARLIEEAEGYPVDDGEVY